MGVHNILGYYVWGINYPRILCRGGAKYPRIFSGEVGYKISKWGAKYYVWGCKISRIFCRGVQNIL